MRFVLGNRILGTVGGTEVHLGTVADELRRLGHEAIVFSPEPGGYADELRRRGLDVRDTLVALPEACDVVLSQDAIVAPQLGSRYPDAVHVFRICGDLFDFQTPPQAEGLLDLVVALSDRYERLARGLSVRVPVLRLRLPIDTARLEPLAPIRRRPQRAVLLGNYQEKHALVREAWEPLGIEVTVVGGPAQRYDVAAALSDADIVVAKSRAALDAMACGRAVYVLDFFGGDGWVTPDLYPALEADHFAGQATDRVLDADALRRDLDAYDAAMGPVNRDLVIQHHTARDHVLALLAAVETVRNGNDTGAHRPDGLAEISRLTSMNWSWQETATEFRRMHWSLREHAAQGEHETRRAVEAAAAAAGAAAAEIEAAHHRTGEVDAALADERERVADLAARLQAAERTAEDLRAARETLRATRAWRLVALWWRLRDRLRRGT